MIAYTFLRLTFAEATKSDIIAFIKLQKFFLILAFEIHNATTYHTLDAP